MLVGFTDPAHVDRTEVIHTYTEVTSSPSPTPEVFQKCLRTTTTTTTKTTKVLSPRRQLSQPNPIPGRGVEITEMLSDEELESNIIPDSDRAESVTETETHIVAQQQSLLPEKIMEESEEERESQAVEIEDESAPNELTPKSLDSRDQSEAIETSTNGHSGDTTEIITTRIYGGEIVDDIISQAISTVNDLPPECDEVEEEVQVEQEENRTLYEDENLVEELYEEEANIDSNVSLIAADSVEAENEPDIPDPDSEEPSSKSDPISVTTPDEEQVSTIPADTEAGALETEEMDPSPAAGAPSSGGKKNRNRKKKGKKGGGGNGN